LTPRDVKEGAKFHDWRHDWGVDEAMREERASEWPGADRSRGECQAGVLLADGYPRDRDRERAVRWLGWVAYHWGTEPVTWWEIPARVPGRWLARVRFAVAVVIVAATLGAAIGFTLWVAITILFLAVVVLGNAGVHVPSRPLQIPRPGPPRQVAPRWPRGRGAVVLVASLIPIVTFMPVLLRQWTEPAHGDAAQTYRADRRTAAARLIAWLGSAGLVAAIVAGAGVPLGAWLGVDLSLAAGAGLFAALTTGPYPMVKLTELILLAQWRQPVSLHRVLTGADAARVLVRAGGRWTFRDEAVRAELAAAHAAELRDRDRAREARAARTTGARARLVAALDARGIARARADLAAGVAMFLLLLGLTLTHGPTRSTWWTIAGMFTAIAAAAGLICYAFAPRLLRQAVACLRWTLVNVAPFSRGTRLSAAAVAVAAAALLIANAGPAIAAFAARVLPAVFVAVCGGWILLVTYRKRRPARRPRGSGSGRSGGGPGAAQWHRRLQDAIVVATTGTALLALARPDVLDVEPAAGLLFPAAGWAGFRAWRAMNTSGRLAVRAAADITLSLLLGADLVLFVVWLANLLGLTRPEVAAVRGALERAGDLADLPWWLWTGLYAALAVAAAAFAVWPARLRWAIGLSAQLRVVPAADAVRRVLTGLHIGLLVIVLVAVAVPAAVFPVLRDQLAARYAVAYQRQLEAAGEQAAYAEISGQFTAAKANRAVLADIVEKIHGIDHPRPGNDHATATEADIARRVGELQAATLLAGTESIATERNAAGTAGFTVPIQDAQDLRMRVMELDEQEKKEDATHERAEQAGDLAAATVASLLSVPDIGRDEVVQIVREYVSGLIEESPLKDVFAAWTQRLAGALRPPDAGPLVVPQPLKLETEALLTQIREGEKEHFAATLPSTEQESAVDAAVDMANQTRYLSEGGTGPCAGCTPAESHDEPVHEPVEEHPVP
jgi:hypothetical protein